MVGKRVLKDQMHEEKKVSISCSFSLTNKIDSIEEKL